MTNYNIRVNKTIFIFLSITTPYIGVSNYLRGKHCYGIVVNILHFWLREPVDEFIDIELFSPLSSATLLTNSVYYNVFRSMKLNFCLAETHPNVMRIN